MVDELHATDQAGAGCALARLNEIHGLHMTDSNIPKKRRRSLYSGKLPATRDEQGRYHVDMPGACRCGYDGPQEQHPCHGAFYCCESVGIRRVVPTPHGPDYVTYACVQCWAAYEKKAKEHDK